MPEVRHLLATYFQRVSSGGPILSFKITHAHTHIHTHNNNNNASNTITPPFQTALKKQHQIYRVRLPLSVPCTLRLYRTQPSPPPLSAVCPIPQDRPPPFPALPPSADVEMHDFTSSPWPGLSPRAGDGGKGSDDEVADLFFLQDAPSASSFPRPRRLFSDLPLSRPLGVRVPSPPPSLPRVVSDLSLSSFQPPSSPAAGTGPPSRAVADATVAKTTTDATSVKPSALTPPPRGSESGQGREGAKGGVAFVETVEVVTFVNHYLVEVRVGFLLWA